MVCQFLIEIANANLASVIQIVFLIFHLQYIQFVMETSVMAELPLMVEAGDCIEMGTDRVSNRINKLGKTPWLLL